MDNTQALSEAVKNKWQPILEHPELPPIKDTYRKNVTAILLENEERALREEAGESLQPLHETTVTSGAAAGSGLGGPNAAVSTAADAGTRKGFDPVLISLVRRAMPNLMAYDVCGVQPMTGPTGLIFALKSNYSVGGGDPASNEAMFNEARIGYAGQAATSSSAGVTASNADIFGAAADSIFHADGSDMSADAIGTRFHTGDAERLGSATTQFQEMTFSIEKTAVTAKSRALKAEYTTELAQDLKAVHGLDAETELANILSTEILAEINREVVRTIYAGAKLGAQHSDLAAMLVAAGSATGIGGSSGGAGGIYDVDADSDGRWSAERFRGLVFQIEREANQIAKDTRRGKGNFVICSADVASALSMSGVLDFSPSFDPGMNVDDTGNTMVGTLGNMKVYVDPYATDVNFCCVGYKGTSPYDAGMFYCPYVPLQMVRAVGENTFQPKIGFKTRYGLVNNPFVVTSAGAITSDPQAAAAARINQYYRVFKINNLHGTDS
jgi:hypothetical protein